MNAEDDFGLWERELDAWEGDGAAGGRGMVLVAAGVAAGCTALIVLGEAPLGALGLIISSVILLLWRIGM